MTPPKTFEEWMEEIPEGFQFAFICITIPVNEDKTQLLCKQRSNGDLCSTIQDFYHCREALRECREKTLEDRFSEFLEEED